MKTYKTYQEAKIDNPEEYVYRLEIQGTFVTSEIGAESIRFQEFQSNGHLANPADYCMTVEEFLKAGHKFVEGDLILDGSCICLISDRRKQDHWYQTDSANKPDIGDSFRYILRAAALKKPKRFKVEYVILDESNFNVWDLKELLSGGELFSKTSDGRYVLYSENSPNYMLRHFSDYGVYRRIEKPIEWWEDLAEYIEKATEDSGYAELIKGEKLHVEASMTRDQWCDFARILLEQGVD